MAALISTHAPRTGSDTARQKNGGLKDISTHAPRTGSDAPLSCESPRVLISTHAPRTGSDNPAEHLQAEFRYFNPRSPHGERLKWQAAYQKCPRNFNPRSPHGERPPPTCKKTEKKLFQSTLPARGATSAMYTIPPGRSFQSTLPARGATVRAAEMIRRIPHFNPRSPHGERLSCQQFAADRLRISIHAPRTGSDHTARPENGGLKDISIHAPRTGSDQAPTQRLTVSEISLHAPRTGSDGDGNE